MKTYNIDDINKTVNFKFPYDIELRKTIKELDLNTRWNAEEKEWIVPINTWTKDKILKIIKQNGFKKSVLKTVDVNFSYKQNPVDFAYLKGLCDAKGFTYEPRDYQLECLGYSIEKGSLINGDDVGTGKTFESIIYTETQNLFPCLVVVPSSVKYNWSKKWLEITGKKREVSIIDSKKENDWTKDVVIINYDIIATKKGTGAVAKYKELLTTPWKMKIFDEAHFLKEKKAQRSKIAKKICDKSDAKIQLLTGTAVMSKPIELWNLLLIIGKEKLIANDWMHFVTRYCGGYKGKFGWVTDGATNTLELNYKLRDNCYIRRESKDVLTDLSEPIKQIVYVEISNQKKIDKATTDFIKFMKEDKGEEAAEKAMEAEHLVALGVLRRLAIEGKLKSIEQYLKDWKTAEKGKLLIFGIHKDGLEYLSKKFKCDLIAGGVNAKKKQEIVDSWNVDKNIFLFANMEAAGTGTDGLQHTSSNMLIIELPWRPSDITQVVGRLQRSGQKSLVTVNFMLSDKTIDVDMWDMLEAKERVVDAVNKGVDVKRNKSGMKQVIKKMLKRVK